MQRKYGVGAALIAPMAVLLAACGGGEDTSSSQSSTTVTTPSSVTTREEVPTAAVPVPSQTTQKPTVPSVDGPVLLGFIREGTGSLGCGDELVMIEDPNVIASPDKVATAMAGILAPKQEAKLADSGLISALWQSNLHYISSLVSGDTVYVRLVGTVVSGGVCDDPRIIAQLEQTAAVAVGVSNAEVRINDIPVELVLSQK